MEVKKHGNTYGEVTCPDCGALLSYCDSDVKEKVFWRLEVEDFVYKRFVKCPECEREIELKI